MQKETSLPANLPPRMLTEEAAAEYCGISLALFRATCPVKARDMAAGLQRKPCLRWNVRFLKEWCDARDNTDAGRSFDDMLEGLGKGNDNQGSRRQ